MKRIAFRITFSQVWLLSTRQVDGVRKKYGEGGIRTLGSISATPVFETGPIGHSGTSPDCCHSLTYVAFLLLLPPFPTAPIKTVVGAPLKSRLVNTATTCRSRCHVRTSFYPSPGPRQGRQTRGVAAESGGDLDHVVNGHPRHPFAKTVQCNSPATPPPTALRAALAMTFSRP
jgi:hypothetical protein